MSYYPHLGIHVRDKVKVLLDLSNNTTKKVLKYSKAMIHLS